MVPLLITVLSIALLVGTVYVLLREPELTSAGAGIAIGVMVATLPLILPMTSFFSALAIGIGGVAITYGVMTIRHHREITALRQQIIELQAAGYRPQPAAAQATGAMATGGAEYGPPADPFEPTAAAGEPAPARPRGYAGGYADEDTGTRSRQGRIGGKASEPGFNSLGRYFRKDAHRQGEAADADPDGSAGPSYMSEDDEILAMAERSRRAAMPAAEPLGTGSGRTLRPGKGENIGSLTRLARRRGC